MFGQMFAKTTRTTLTFRLRHLLRCRCGIGRCRWFSEKILHLSPFERWCRGLVRPIKSRGESLRWLNGVNCCGLSITTRYRFLQQIHPTIHLTLSPDFRKLEQHHDQIDGGDGQQNKNPGTPVESDRVHHCRTSPCRLCRAMAIKPVARRYGIRYGKGHGYLGHVLGTPLRVNSADHSLAVNPAKSGAACCFRHVSGAKPEKRRSKTG